MASSKLRQAFLFADECGVPCMSVPIGHRDETAIVWKTDYDRLIAAGVSPHWRTISQPRTTPRQLISDHPGLGRLSIAQVVLSEAADCRMVRHLNGDELDVRRSNLSVRKIIKK